MKRIILAFILLSLIAIPLMAQNDTIAEAIKRIEKIEQQLSSLNATVQEVTAQNLALKKNLNLKPTIAKAKLKDVEFRVIEVTGDPLTKEVHLVITANNGTDTDIEMQCKGLEIIDELGHGYNDDTRKTVKIEGVTDSFIFTIINYRINTPLTIDVYIKNYNPEAQYIKHMALKAFGSSLAGDEATFQNLPIKWVASED